MPTQSQAISIMAGEIADFLAEVEELSALLESLTPAAWNLETQFKGWTINDVILHLFASDYTAMTAAQAVENFNALRNDMLRLRQSGLSMIEESRLRFPDLRGAALGSAWRVQAVALCRALGLKDPQDKLPWSGPAMSVRTFAAARQMETWAHGQEIYDILGGTRTARDRIKNIAILGVKTFAWSFANRGLPVPQNKPQITLKAPSGETWCWNVENEENLIVGPAEDFCLVVTQTRNFADTRLSVIGDISRHWISIAQCFAGPPADPPLPGARHRVNLNIKRQTNFVPHDTLQEKIENA